MKQIFNPIITGLLFILILGSCDVNEQFDWLDEKTKPTNKADYAYQLIDADYSTISKRALVAAQNAADSALARSISTNKYLSASTPSETYIPYLLNTKYQYGDIGSTARITFSYNLNDLGYLTSYTSAAKYTVSSANYSLVGGKVELLGSFTPSYPAEDFIPTFLPSALTGSTEGRLALITYKTSPIEPSLSDIPVIITKFSDNFEGGNLNNFDKFNVTGAPEWNISSYGGTLFAKISGYVSGTGNTENEDWLILSSLDLSSAVTASLSFTTAHKYAGNPLVLKYSTDYVEGSTPSEATWSNLNFNYEAGTGNFTWSPSGSINLPGIPNSNISIAFVYTSTATASSTWEIDNVLVTYKDLNSDIPVQVHNDYYKYSNSTWVKASRVVCVSPYEYSEMSSSEGTNSFSSALPPAKYLPVYLKSKYPLAAEGDTSVVVYNYTSGSTTSLQAKKYEYKSGVWSEYSSITDKTDPFAYSSVGWVFDPTVNVTMTKADYQIIVDYVKSQSEMMKYVDSYGTAEFYYGASGYYGEFNIQISKHRSYEPETFGSITDEEATALIWQRVHQGIIIFLQKKYPLAVTQVNGVDVHYKVTFVAYISSMVNYESVFKCISDGDGTVEAGFEFVSGPVKL